MKMIAWCWMASVILGLVSVSPTQAGPPAVVDGVAVTASRDGGEEKPAPVPSALTSSSIDFDTPELFSDTLPLQIFQSLRTSAYFLGRGAVLDAASFEVTGTSGKSVLAFNGRTAVYGDGTVPRLPELVIFVKPDLSAISPKQTVSINVGSKRDEGRTVALIAFDRSLQMVAFDSLQVAPQMQTLTVNTATPEIVVIGLFGESELKVLAVDNLVYN